MSNYGLTPEMAERHFSLLPTRVGQCSLLLLSMATHLLMGCHTETTVQSGRRTAAMSSNLPANRQPLQLRGVAHDVEKTDHSFDLLNSELVNCSLDGGRNAVEPGWSVHPWYNKTEVYGKDRMQLMLKKMVPALAFEPLFQKLRISSLGNSGPSLPNRLSASCAMNVSSLGNSSEPFRPEGFRKAPRIGKGFHSMTLFNKRAAIKVKELYDKWPVGVTGTSDINTMVFDPKDTARIMKLEFSRSDLLSQCKLSPGTLLCTVKLIPERGKNLENYQIKMDPAIGCSDSTDARSQEQPKADTSIPMDCFYYVVVHRSNSNNYLEYATFDYRRGYKGNSPLKLDPKHDIVYLLQGFHLMESNTPTWTWSTFWWTPHRRTDKVCEAFGNLRCKDPCKVLQTAGVGGTGPRPLACEEPWAFYATDQQEYDGTHVLAVTNPERHFNPYIEKPTSTSNCIYCHARALYHDPQKPSKPVDDLRLADTLPGPAAAMLPCFTQSTPHGTQLLPRSVPGDVVCDYAKPTHFLWSLANALADRQLQQPR